MKKVSVIIPVYKVEQYLRPCLDSVVTQSYKDLEIIVIDDCSSDRCGEIAEEYAIKDNRVSVIHNLSNKGLSTSRNEGIEHATGEYLFFVDSDDRLMPEAISRLVTKAESGILVITGYDLEIMPDGIITTPKQAYGQFHSLDEWLGNFSQIFATKFNFAWGKLYLHDIIEKNGIRFRKGISLVEDLLFNMEYYEHCDKFVLDEYNGYVYRQTGGTSLSKKFDTRMIEWNIMSFTSLVDYLKKHLQYTDANRRHLLNNAFGNFKYNFHLLALNADFTTSRKCEIIKVALDNPFVAKVVAESDTPVNRFQMVLQRLLRQRMIRSYIVLENLRNKLR